MNNATNSNIGKKFREELFIDNNKKMAILFYIAAICFYVAAAIVFLDRSSGNNMGIIFLCLGSSWVGIGASFSNKYKNKDKDNSSNNQEK